MNMKFAGLVVAASGLLQGCASLPESLVASPVVQLSGVQIAGLGFKRQTFHLSFDVSNPNPFALPVTAVGYDVRLEGRRFASGETVGEFSIPANADSEFAISVELDLLSTAPQLLSVIRDGSRRSIRYELNGSMTVDLPLSPMLRYATEGDVRLDGSTTSFLRH